MAEHRNVPAGTLPDWEGVDRELTRDYDCLRFPPLLQVDLEGLPRLRELLDAFERDALACRDAVNRACCRCAIDGPGEVIPPACPVHGVPCEHCGGIEECKPGCSDGPAA